MVELQAQDVVSSNLHCFGWHPELVDEVEELEKTRSRKTAQALQPDQLDPHSFRLMRKRVPPDKYGLLLVEYAAW